MKTMSFIFVSLLFSSAAFAKDYCARQAERYTPGPGNIGQAQLIEQTEDGLLHYDVRVQLNGGTSAWVITLTPECKFVSRRLSWTD